MNVFLEAAYFDSLRTAATGRARSVSSPMRAIATSAASILLSPSPVPRLPPA